jgi:hypothetical protein
MTILHLFHTAIAQLRGAHTTAERYYVSCDIATLRTDFEKARDPKTKVSPSVLLAIRTLLAPQCRVGSDKRRLAQEFNEQLFAKWRTENEDAHVYAIPPVGIVHYRTEGCEPYLDIALSGSGGPDFSWVSARDLLQRAELISDMAALWVPAEKQQRSPHIERATGLATQILAVVGREWRRRADACVAHSAPPSDSFFAELDGLRPHIEHAEQLLIMAATNRAQSWYLKGVAAGALAMALLSVIGGVALYHFGLDAALGVALPAGALGAVISVLQRLTSGSLDLDFRAPKNRRVWVFGFVRPWIGGVFGMVIYSLLQSGLLGLNAQAPDGVGPQLAYFGIVGFLAGFNERFAQDAVSGSARPLGASLSSSGSASSSPGGIP